MAMVQCIIHSSPCALHWRLLVALSTLLFVIIARTEGGTLAQPKKKTSEKLWQFIFRWLIQIAVIRYAYLLVFPSYVHSLSTFSLLALCISRIFRWLSAQMLWVTLFGTWVALPVRYSFKLFIPCWCLWEYSFFWFLYIIVSVCVGVCGLMWESLLRHGGAVLVRCHHCCKRQMFVINWICSK